MCACACVCRIDKNTGVVKTKDSDRENARKVFGCTLENIVVVVFFFCLYL